MKIRSVSNNYLEPNKSQCKPSFRKIDTIFTIQAIENLQHAYIQNKALLENAFPDVNPFTVISDIKKYVIDPYTNSLNKFTEKFEGFAEFDVPLNNDGIPNRLIKSKIKLTIPTLTASGCLKLSFFPDPKKSCINIGSFNAYEILPRRNKEGKFTYNIANRVFFERLLKKLKENGFIPKMVDQTFVFIKNNL